jgi:hypothetical protein
MINPSKNVVHVLNVINNCNTMFTDQSEKGISASITNGEKTTTLLVKIVIKVVAKTKFGPFASGFEKGNPIVVGATGVTLKAT